MIDVRWDSRIQCTLKAKVVMLDLMDHYYKHWNTVLIFEKDDGWSIN